MPVAIVWPCPLSVDAYAAAGREVDAPRPQCPLCGVPMRFWSGYQRWVREAGRCRRIFVPRVRCGRCQVSHALLPAFLLAGRLDVAGSVGQVIEAVTAIRCAFAAACEFPGWVGLGRWRFASAVSGGRLLAANMISPYLVVGRRRFLPPVAENRVGTGGETWTVS